MKPGNLQSRISWKTVKNGDGGEVKVLTLLRTPTTGFSPVFLKG